ncbi:paraquat-inducible protein A [Sideroxydans sp. CL21]|uniref:paraquat-inducible protein A n=1 Tax=Sideroxydans sp. CL21 TaxID=2600596 RepID=UPI0024BCE82C|nr:paraquat-inducible protein A [Sideroxydans sp. CL21]
MKLFNIILSAITVIAAVLLCQQIISNSVINQQNKNDYAELNHVKYGLLSIDEWKRQVTVILAAEINKLYLSRANERVIRKHIETLLNTLIDQVDKKIRKDNSETAGGRLSQSFIDLFVNLKEIKKGIPEYTDAVMHELTKAKTKHQVKAVLRKQLEKYSKLTFDFQDTPELTRILLRTGSADVETARVKLNDQIALKHDLIVKEEILLILLAVLLFVVSGFSKESLTPSRYASLVLILVVLLSAGVTTPTIDMEAKISQMSFMLLGNPVHFENQVLYFQSKSILDVFRIMIEHREIKMKLVGILLITFSIIFPLLKIASTLGFYFDIRHARRNPVIRFFVLYSGKWSMADVMVVAIFMAYIGFDGIIANQLSHLNSSGEELVLLTTNGTSLQPGYYLFLTYTLLALFLSELLTKKHHAEERRNPYVEVGPK